MNEPNARVMNEPKTRATMNIFESTRRYESWMGGHVQPISRQLVDKHAMMKGDLFAFFRGTYYRWAQLWRSAVPKSVQAAPAVLAVGDLHVDSFGTWRDVEGRLIWGVDDFDEAFPLPYTNDLVRLAASVKIAAKAGALKISLRDACDAIMEGYHASLRKGGAPSTLAEEEHFHQDAFTPDNDTDHDHVDLSEIRASVEATIASPVSAQVAHIEAAMVKTGARDSRAARAAQARLKGFEGDGCGACGNFTLVRNGTCLKCNTCGSTSGCS